MKAAKPRGRPPKAEADKKQTTVFQVRMDDDLAEKLRYLAEFSGRSRNSLMCHLLESATRSAAMYELVIWHSHKDDYIALSNFMARVLDTTQVVTQGNWTEDAYTKETFLTLYEQVATAFLAKGEPKHPDHLLFDKKSLRQAIINSTILELFDYWADIAFYLKDQTSLDLWECVSLDAKAKISQGD